MDTLKTRLQATTTTTREVPEEAAPLRLSGLYRGVGENVLKEAPDTAVFLAISEQLTQSLAYSNPFFATHLTLTLLLSGAVGDAAGSVFRLPAEVLCDIIALAASKADARRDDYDDLATVRSGARHLFLPAPGSSGIREALFDAVFGLA